MSLSCFEALATQFLGRDPVSKNAVFSQKQIDLEIWKGKKKRRVQFYELA
jgi:hypothetical protein